jgi:type IV secretory pathway component VirB8
VLCPFLFALFKSGKKILEERKKLTMGLEFLRIDPMADGIRLEHPVGFDELGYRCGGMAKGSCGDSLRANS